MDTNYFFELVQTAIGNREKLSAVPSTEEWTGLFETAQRQTVAAVCMAGVSRLPEEQKPPMKLLMEWVGQGEVAKGKNERMNRRCMTLIRKLEGAGLKATILKGQGIAKLYTKDKLGELRQSGDIDVFVEGGMEHALRKVKEMGVKVDHWDYKHAQLVIWDDTSVELHYRVEVMFNLVKNRRLQRWFGQESGELFERNAETGFVTPTVAFNVFYILLHIYRHFFTEGVGLRQVMDYYMVLRTVNGEKRDVRSAVAAVSEFGMERFARGLMWVMQEVMAMPREWMPWEPDEREGRFILEQVMEGGNFGHHSSKGSQQTGGRGYVTRIVRHSLHLMRRYPSEALWSPVWVVWHKGWKMMKTAELRIQRRNGNGDA